jgi:hypothetical protein
MTVQATADVTEYDAAAGMWRTVTRPVFGTPARTARRPARRTARRVGQPSDRAGLSDGSPFAYGMSDTAFAPGEPLADMRTYVKEPTITTHRAAVVVPAGRASDATAGTRWHDL